MECYHAINKNEINLLEICPRCAAKWKKSRTNIYLHGLIFTFEIISEYRSVEREKKDTHQNIKSYQWRNGIWSIEN